jgi:hypothetical protein
MLKAKGDKYVIHAISDPIGFGLSPLAPPPNGECQGINHYINAIIATSVFSIDANSMTLLFYRQDRDRIAVKIEGFRSVIGFFGETDWEVGVEQDVLVTVLHKAMDVCKTFPKWT